MTDLDAFNRAWLAARVRRIEDDVSFAGREEALRLFAVGLLAPFPGGCAINLAFLVRKPFTPHARLDLVRLRHAARVAAAFGVVGVVGWGDALAQMDVEHGSENDAALRATVIGDTITTAAPDYAARALGVSPGWGPAGEYSRTLREKIMDDQPNEPGDLETARVAADTLSQSFIPAAGVAVDHDPRAEVGERRSMRDNFDVMKDHVLNSPEWNAPRPRPDVLDARVFKMKWHGDNYYVTLSSEDDRLRELFVTGPEAREWVEALARVVTAVLRTAEDPSFLFRELKRIPSAAGAAPVAALDGWLAPSIVAAIGALMEAEHARLSAPRHERAQADYAARRRDRPASTDVANPAPSWRPEQDDGFPWGFRDDGGVFTELPKTPLLLAGYGPPPFDVTLPSGEVRHVERRR